MSIYFNQKSGFGFCTLKCMFSWLACWPLTQEKKSLVYVQALMKLLFGVVVVVIINII